MANIASTSPHVMMKPHMSSTLTRTLISCNSPGRRFISVRPLRVISQTCKMSSIAPKPNFSSNYDPEQGVKDLEPLLRGNGGKWSLTESGKGVERWFKFKTFKKTWVGACYTSTRDGADRPGLGVHEYHRCRMHDEETSPGMVECS
jgi:hypothetical protein